MNILLHSHHYAPSVGGIESMSKTLADEWHNMGHHVTVTTTTLGADLQGHAWTVLVNPSFWQMRRLVQDIDVYIQNNISLKKILPWILTGKPLFIVTHIWLQHGKSYSVAAFLKRRVLSFGFVHNISISQAIAKHLPAKSVHIANAYNDRKFIVLNHVIRDIDFVYLGRFVSDKGVDLLIEAMTLLKNKGQRFSASFIGGGPEESALMKMVLEQGLEKNVKFKGKMVGQSLVEELNRHRFIVVPSRWAEPFGLVALEGLACGCIPLVSDGGGLPEAVGECGFTFKSGDAHDLARMLSELAPDKNLADRLKQKIEQHLKKHSARVVAERYLEEFSKQ